MYRKFGFVYTWMYQNENFVDNVYRFALAECELRRPRVAEGRCCFAVAVGKERNYTVYNLYHFISISFLYFSL